MTSSDGNGHRPRWTRRKFLQMVGMAGGSAAVYETMTALGLINKPEAFAGPPRIRTAPGEGQTVLILGAGIGGLTTAFELMRAGYKVQILEAQDRAGGRSLTARRGTKIHEAAPGREPTVQTCEFDEGLYLNMGPGRLPYHHRRVLHYCQVLGVPLEVYVMTTEANLFQTPQAFDGRAMVRRRMMNDTRGYVSELLAKCIRKKSLDEELDDGDRKKLLSLLQAFGDLGRAAHGETCDPYDYCGSTRNGCACGPPVDPLACDPCNGADNPPTVYRACEPTKPLPLASLLDAEFWKHSFYQPAEYEWQPTLFQPVGGMDQIVHGFLRKVGSLIEYQAEVTKVHLTDDGVEVYYRDRATGEEHQRSADYCVSNIPLPVLQKIEANFSTDFQEAVDRGHFDPTCKVGWQADERFWEKDCYQIYGGISYIDDLITQIWYPSNDYFSGKGTLTGTYNYKEDAVEMGNMGLRERLLAARTGGEKLHPEIGDDAVVPLDKGPSIAWQNVPFQRGGWADWDPDSTEDRDAYARLLAPDRRFHVVGDQVSHLPGWQEGAMMSAEHVVEQIGGFRALTVPEILRAPASRKLTQGRFRE